MYCLFSPVMFKHLSILLLVAAAIVGAAKPEDNDSCYSFAGGSVYPAEQPKGDHQLQYTKAVSECGVNYSLKTMIKSLYSVFSSIQASATI